MIDSTPLALTGYLGQAACAVLIAVVLQIFHRHYRREYLRHWAWSWWAFAVYLLGAGLGFYLRPLLPAASPVRLTVSTLSMLGGYGQICWLLFGSYEVATGRIVPRRVARWVLVALLVVVPLSILMTAELPSPEARLIYRLGIRVLLSGLAFCAAAWSMLRGRLRTAGLGRKLMGGAFLVYGLDQLQYFGGFVAQAWLDRSIAYMNVMSGFDLLLQAVMGMGMVIWLLEEERGYLVAAAEQIEHLAFHDALTGLPNRNLFMDHLRLALALAHRDHRSVAVLFLDLDRFKTINDSLGHSAGDDLLRIVASRLRGALREGDTVARLGGDEFTVVLPAIEDERAAVRVAEKVLDLVRCPLTLHDREIVITCSVGISLFPRDDQSSEELLKKADIAMYQAKQRGRDAFQLYLPSMDVGALERLSLENDLRRALAQQELCLYYQPILDCRTGRIEAVEALLRWNHPERGLMWPGEFLPLAEHAGLSKPIDLWVLHTACQEVRSWHQAGADVRVTVNLSARPFQQPDLIVQVKDALEESGLPASSLELEITETLAMQNAEVSLAVLRALKELGLRIAIDDFGTGYSSLSYLRTFPIDTLKIDESFVRSLNAGDIHAEIPAAIIALAHSLQIRVVAEGVEEEAQWRLLHERGCDEVQGYFFSPPVPAAECRDLILRQTNGKVAAAG